MSGLIPKVFGGAFIASTAAILVRQSARQEAVRSNHVALKFDTDIEVAGEMFRRSSFRKIFRSLGRPDGGVTMQMAQLVPEPKNKYDRHAVRVMVMGQHVGYVPRTLSPYIAYLCNDIGRGNVATVLARIWARNDNGIWYARVTLMFEHRWENERDYAAEARAAKSRTGRRRTRRAK